jgi:hypothetical protein
MFFLIRICFKMNLVGVEYSGASVCSAELQVTARPRVLTWMQIQVSSR